MKFAMFAEITTVALVGALAFSTFATASEPSSHDCFAMARTVKTALDAHPDASTDAWSHYRTGLGFCQQGQNAYGITNLQAAMKALGS